MRRGQSEALAALTAGYTQDAAAEAAGVNASTIRRWLRHDADFCNELRSLRTESMAEARRVLVANAVDAAAQLVRLANGKHGNQPVRLGALKLLLSTAEEGDLEARIAALEDTIATEPLRVV